MKKGRCFLLQCGIAGLLWISLPAELVAERFYFDDQELPESIEDLKAIEEKLKLALRKVRGATVSIDLGQGYGSGVVVSPEGLVLTAAHVSQAVGKELTVIFEDGRKAQGKALGLVSTSDAAMVQITEKNEKGWPFVKINGGAVEAETTIADPGNLELGDWVFALGYLGGYDKERGAVARIGRMVQVGEDTLRTDCQLLGGDSGGPLFNMSGELVGIHSRVARNLEGNMHVPMGEFRKHWKGMLDGQFIGNGPFAHRPDSIRDILGIKVKEQKKEGLRIVDTLKKGLAESSGLKTDDLLKKVNGDQLERKATLRTAIENCQNEGGTLRFLVERKGEELELTVPIKKKGED